MPRRGISSSTSSVVRSSFTIVHPLNSFLEPCKISVFGLDLGVCRLDHLFEYLDFCIFLLNLLLHILECGLCELSDLHFSLKQLLLCLFTLCSTSSESVLELFDLLSVSVLDIFVIEELLVFHLEL